MTQTFYATSADTGVRIDQFLVSMLHDKTRGDVIRMIASGVFVVDGRQVKPSYRLKGTEVIEMGDYIEQNTHITPNKNIVIDIVENTPDFVVINKAQGIQVHPSHREREKTLVNAVLARFPEVSGVGDDAERPGIVHRLDKDTTGLLVIAKNHHAFTQLKDAFARRAVDKTYHAIVFGHFDEKSSIIDAPIARATSYTKQKIAFGKYRGDARDAQTAYDVLEQYSINGVNFSLIAAHPKTGRTHQIRVHMAHIGHPLLGDTRYYTKNERKIHIPIPQEYDTQTFYLHAQSLVFSLDGADYHFTVPYPKRFSALVRYLRGGNL